MAMGNPLAWFEIYVNDIDRAVKFYEGVLATSLTKMDAPASMDNGLEMWGFPSDMTQYGASGAIVKVDGMEAGGNSTMAYFGCEDCAVEQSRVEANGGKVVQPKFSIGEFGWIAMATDPDGNKIGFHSMS